MHLKQRDAYLFESYVVAEIYDQMTLVIPKSKFPDKAKLKCQIIFPRVSHNLMIKFAVFHAVGDLIFEKISVAETSKVPWDILQNPTKVMIE